MTLINLIIILALIGLMLWAVTKYVPMDPTIHKIMVAVVVIAVILWLLKTFGLLGSAGVITV